MGSPVSRIVADIYMVFLEQAAIATVPLEYKPRLWKRYVDNILEVINKEAVKGLTEHLNQIDTTGRQEIYQKHQETMTVRAEQICNHRPYQHRKSHYRLGRGDNYRPGIWADNSMDQGGCQNWTGRPRHHEQSLPAVPRLRRLTTLLAASFQFKESDSFCQNVTSLNKYLGCFSINRFNSYET